MALDNNFSTFRSDFLSDTGLDWKTNIDTYIQYYQARVLDQMMQQQKAQMEDLIDEVSDLD